MPLIENTLNTEIQQREQVISRDKKALDILGYKPKEVASLLQPIIKKSHLEYNYDLGSGSFIYTAPNKKLFFVIVFQFMGISMCPFEDEKSYLDNSMDLHLREITTKERSKVKKIIGLSATDREVRENPNLYTKIPGHLIHRIRSHGFFEIGEDRVAPETIVEMFGEERNSGSFEKVKELTI